MDVEALTPGASLFVPFTGDTSNLLTLQQTILACARYHQIKVHSTRPEP